ncbi:MAG: hypothetical protein GY699_23755 [Desulfobacteraceae bacterium]|nr:hypothetical protein [Desulfobacteraceae bacterium]
MDLQYNSFALKKRIIQILIFILLISLTLVVVLKYISATDTTRTKFPLKSKSVSRPFHDIKTFYYSKTEKGQRVFTIQADRFRVQKKKLGMIRFGLVKEVVVDNAKIDIYQIPETQINLQTIVDPKTLSKFKANKSKNIIFKPVTLRVLAEKGMPVTTISAQSAGVDIKDKKFVFKENVKVVSSGKTLYAGSLSMTSKGGEMVARDGFVLKLPEQIIKGDTLHTNIFLTSYTQNLGGL